MIPNWQMIKEMSATIFSRHNRLLAVGYDVHYPGLGDDPNEFTYWLSGWQRPSAEELRRSGYTVNTYPGGVDWSHQVSFSSGWVKKLTDEQFGKLIEASRKGFRNKGPASVVYES